MESIDPSEVALVTDLSGTLIFPKPDLARHYRREALNYLSESKTPSVERIRDRFAVAFHHVGLPGDELRYGQTLTEGLWFWKRIIGSVFPGAAPNELSELTRTLYKKFTQTSAWSVYPSARETLQSLKEQGVTLALLSNFDARGPVLLKNLDLHSLFDVIIFSFEAGVEKPNPKIFDLVRDRMAIKHDRVVMIGNYVEIDLRVPESRGWISLLHKPGSDDDWDREIDSWEQVLEYVWE